MERIAFFIVVAIVAIILLKILIGVAG